VKAILNDHTRQAIDAYLQSHRDRYIEDLRELVRIPSVSALGEHRADMDRAAEWLAERLRQAGAPRVQVCRTAGNPIVLGGWPAPTPDAPTLIVYGHYDTQPADPLEEWTTPPFEPSIRDGKLYGRGATDDKGSMLAAVFAAEAVADVAGAPPIGLTFLLEGEEEITSPSLPAFLNERRAELEARVVLSADSAMWSNDEPSLILGCKGLLAMDVTVRTAASDLHSGLFGGIAPNAALVLTQLIATMIAPSGEFLVDGFTDAARPITDADRELLAQPALDVAELLESNGIAESFGEPGFDPLARNWHRPTLEVNGIHSGFGGQGVKTVTPATAFAKLTCRLAEGQDPEDVAQALERHLRSHVPSWVELDITRHPGAVRAFSIQRHDPAMQAAADALRAVYGRAPLVTYIGGTLPVATVIEDVLGLKTVMLAWEMPDENLHAPDEYFRLENLDLACRAYADVFYGIASGAAN
jgi:acetylornithine deacetylase/succinyl-diaminopimelate desuccinylase-like protein